MVNRDFEVTRFLTMALFPEGCGIDPTHLDILTPELGEGRVQVRVTAYLEDGALDRLYKILHTGLGLGTIQEPVNQAKAPEIPSDGFPMSSIPCTDFHKDKHVMLLMGGQWLRGGWNREFDIFCSSLDGEKSMGWDRKNQPTAWRPL